MDALYHRKHNRLSPDGVLARDAVVEGTILKSGSQVRITAQLIEAPLDKHLWAQSYEGDLHDVLSLQNKVARTIAEEIQVTLTPGERVLLMDGRPVNPGGIPRLSPRPLLLEQA